MANGVSTALTHLPLHQLAHSVAEPWGEVFRPNQEPLTACVCVIQRPGVIEFEESWPRWIVGQHGHGTVCIGEMEINLRPTDVAYVPRGHGIVVHPGSQSPQFSFVMFIQHDGAALA